MIALSDRTAITCRLKQKMNPGNTWVREEPLVGLEPTTSGLQIRFYKIAEYHSCSFCAHIEPPQYAEYHKNMYLFIVVDVTVDVKRSL